ncbi:hypothetical protein QYE76_036929 [Lolium multiflorum]|uniref:Jacalin-type lectin domain-containing protein n=1 Tax=Lolium multiflorum TaxID=4521 RepID=A0AAD8R3E1_LOLMU|nr:hypothetical protein QYE76_036929 [Lolium multiflorum]
MTDEQNNAIVDAELKEHFAPKPPPPKLFIAPHTVRHFAETRAKKAELASDYDRSLGQSSRAKKAEYGSRPLTGRTIPQLGQQENQSLAPLVVHSYDDPETRELIERSARQLGATIEYDDYFPMAEPVYKYKYGMPLVSNDKLPLLQTQMRKLHDWYMQASHNSEAYLVVGIKDEHYFRGNEEINIEFEELFQLFNQDALDKSLMSCYCLMKMLECRRGGLYDIGFIDPNTVHELTVRDYPKDTEENLLSFHYIFLIIQLDKGVVLVMDSKRKEHGQWANLGAMLQRAWKRFIKTDRGEWKPELTFKDYPDAPKKLGPSGYGGIQGTAKDINSNSVPKTLKSVSIWSKGGNTGRINAISFTYYDKDNIEVNEGPWGTTDGTPNVISIGHDEYLTKLCVTTANNCVTSLTFNTSKPAVHGPMGKEPTTGDKAFTIDVDPDSIVAFFGRADHYLRAIGAYSAPQA